MAMADLDINIDAFFEALSLTATQRPSKLSTMTIGESTGTNYTATTNGCHDNFGINSRPNGGGGGLEKSELESLNWGYDAWCGIFGKELLDQSLDVLQGFQDSTPAQENQNPPPPPQENQDPATQRKSPIHPKSKPQNAVDYFSSQRSQYDRYLAYQYWKKMESEFPWLKNVDTMLFNQLDFDDSTQLHVGKYLDWLKLSDDNVRTYAKTHGISVESAKSNISIVEELEKAKSAMLDAGFTNFGNSLHEDHFRDLHLEHHTTFTDPNHQQSLKRSSWSYPADNNGSMSNSNKNKVDVDVQARFQGPSPFKVSPPSPLTPRGYESLSRSFNRDRDYFQGRPNLAKPRMGSFPSKNERYREHKQKVYYNSHQRTPPKTNGNGNGNGGYGNGMTNGHGHGHGHGGYGNGNGMTNGHSHGGYGNGNEMTNGHGHGHGGYGNGMTNGHGGSGHVNGNSGTESAYYKDNGTDVTDFYCGFCYRSGAGVVEYRGHNMLQPGCDKVECPRLRECICPLCGSTGDDAHTKSHCRLNQYVKKGFN